MEDERKARTPVYISTKLYPNTMDLLYWETGGTTVPNESNKGHYACIMNLSAFMADVKAAKGHNLPWCKKCLAHFQSENVYDLTSAIVVGWRAGVKSS